MSATASTFTTEMRLARLASDERMTCFVTEAGRRHGWWDADRRWQRTFGRFDPDARRYCVMLFESTTDTQELCLLEVYYADPPGADEASALSYDSLLGWLRFSRFPHDPRLPTLRAVRAGFNGVHVLRYRPERRCTMSVTDANSGGRTFVKVLANGDGNTIHAGAGALWRASLRGEIAFDVAKPIRWDSQLSALWQHAVAGQPLVRQLLQPGGQTIAARMGRACASLAVSSLKANEVFDARAQCQRSVRYASELSRRLPQFEVEIRDVIARLQRVHRQYIHRTPRPIHGAPHAHQWLDAGGRLGLVDFDRFSMGDPELDVATFVAEMDFEDPARVPVAAINQQFLASYESVYGPLQHSLIDTYRCHKYLAKSLKAVRAVSVNGVAKAERHLRRTIAGVEALNP